MGHRTTRPHATLKACRIRWYAVALAVLTWLAVPVLAQTGPAQVDRVIDGDTIRVRLDGDRFTVRLTGVDTPETTHPTRGVEPYGPEAAAYTTARLTGASSGTSCSPAARTSTRPYPRRVRQGHSSVPVLPASGISTAGNPGPARQAGAMGRRDYHRRHHPMTSEIATAGKRSTKASKGTEHHARPHRQSGRGARRDGRAGRDDGHDREPRGSRGLGCPRDPCRRPGRRLPPRGSAGRPHQAPVGALGEPPQLVRDITHRGQATPAVGDCPASGPASEPALREAIEAPRGPFARPGAAQGVLRAKSSGWASVSG